MKSILYQYSLALAILTVALFGCKKDSSRIDTSSLPRQNVDQYQLDIVPYQNNQLVKFMGSDGIVRVTKVETIVHNDSVSSCINCKPDYIEQYIEVYLRDTAYYHSSFLAKFGLVKRTENEVFLTVVSPFGGYQSGKSFDLFTVSKTPDFDCGYYTNTCIDTTIEGFSYTDMVKIQQPVINQWQNELVAVYYSKQYGIVKFNHINGQSFSLIR